METMPFVFWFFFLWIDGNHASDFVFISGLSLMEDYAISVQIWRIEF